METTKSTFKKQKIKWKSARRKCRSPLNHKLFKENFIHDLENIQLSQWEYQCQDNVIRFQEGPIIRTYLKKCLRKFLKSFGIEVI